MVVSPVRHAARPGADPRVLDPNALTALALGDNGIEVRLLDLARLSDPELVATGFLAEPEQAEYAELRHPLRRREWLGARVCLKLMAVGQGLVGAPVDCAVIKDPRGRPRLVFDPNPGGPFPFPEREPDPVPPEEIDVDIASLRALLLNK